MPLSEQEIRIAWRALTDESLPDISLIGQMGQLPSVAALRQLVMQTHAFQVSLPRATAKVPLNAPPLTVECSADPAIERALLALVTAKWRALGVERPHWSVTGRDEFLPDRIADNRAAFDLSGQEDLATIRAILIRNGLSPEMFHHACDFGCGVGRVTLPMAAAFPRVTGCDVSAEHLRMAQSEANNHLRMAQSEANNRGIRFVLVEPPDFGMTEKFDLWFSHLVLQHNPPPIMAAILRRMFALLAPGGVALFQIPTYIRGYAFDCASYLRAPPAQAIEVHVLPQQHVLALARDAGCDVLEIREDTAVWPPSEAVSNTMLFRKR